MTFVVPIDQFHFSEISLLITHYNRSSSLKRLLLSFEKLNCSFGEIIVSDDGSERAHLDVLIELAERHRFKLIIAKMNRGLGNNINKGQDAIINKYTLYVQEDFVPTADLPTNLKIALEMMIADDELDIVRLYAYIMYPYLKDYKLDFSEMYLPFLGVKYTKMYQYSDHPHLRRSAFFTKFGRYQEGIKGDKMEYNMCVSFIRNNGKGLFYNNFTELFLQENSIHEPSTMKRELWKESNNFFIFIVREVYRQIKNNYQIYITKSLEK